MVMYWYLLMNFLLLMKNFRFWLWEIVVRILLGLVIVLVVRWGIVICCRWC